MVNKIVSKSFTIVIIFLLIIISMFPTSIGFSSFDDPFTIIIEGTLGDNGWYISPVNITIIINPDMCKEVWYNIGDGYQKYQEPFTISKEGCIFLCLYWVDMEGIKNYLLPFEIRIDMSPPTVEISKRPGYAHVTFTARAFDNASEIVQVEFYLDDEFQAVTNKEPYQWTYNGTGSHLVYAKAYNDAGLYNESGKISTPRFISLNNHNIIYPQRINKRDTLSIFFHRLYCFGPIYNLTIDNDTHVFESDNLRIIEIFFLNIRDWELSYSHWTGITCIFGPGMKFRGILKPTFICGYFY